MKNSWYMTISLFLLFSSLASSNCPEEDWSCYVGGSNADYGKKVRTDNQGNAYVVESTLSSDVNGAINSYNAGYDGLLAKISPGGNLVWSRYFGGSGSDSIGDIEIDSSGNIYVTGNTDSNDLEGASNSIFGGTDAFVAKFDSNGTLLNCRYVGGTNLDEGRAIELDSTRIYIAGSTRSTDLENPTNSLKGFEDAYVTVIDVNFSVIWSTYLGGTGLDVAEEIRVNSIGNIAVVGSTYSTNFYGAGNSFHGGSWDGFVARVNSSGSQICAFYIGGSGYDWAHDIVIDSYGYSWVVGGTDSTDLDQSSNSYQGGTYDAFIAKFSSGCSLQWTRYLGGSDYDTGYGISLTAAEKLTVTGHTQSSDFEGLCNGGVLGDFDAFVTKLNSDGTVKWSIITGGSNGDQTDGIALDGNDDILIAGHTNSTDLPDSSNSYQGGIYDAFVIKINTNEIDVIAPNGGEELIAGETYNIKWFAPTDIEDVNIQLSTNNGQIWSDVNTMTENDGPYQWLIPNTSSNQCLVRISDANCTSSAKMRQIYL